jgi:cell division protein FtsI (penicillin-binding protein 3)
LGRVKAPELPRKRQDFHTIYNTCFGTGFRMTILQTLVYFNAVANNGKMITPLFVKEVVDLKGNRTTYKAEVLKEQICKPSTTQRARKYLEQVVYGKDGIAKRYQDSVVVTFAGKTGTRDVWDESTKQYLYDHNSVSFCGYFPADNPKYTCIVYIHNVTKKSGTAVSLFAKILNKISNHTYDKPVVSTQNGRKLPSFINVPADAYGAIALSLQMDDASLPETAYVSGTYSGKNFELKESQLSKNRNIPNVTGMSAIDATHALNRAGYKVLIQNRGKVQKQINNEEQKTVTLILK